MKKINGTLVFMSVFIITLCGLLVYNQFTIHKLLTENKNEKNTKVDKTETQEKKEKNKVEKLELTNDLAVQYYNYLKMDETLQDVFFTIDLDHQTITPKEVKKDDLSASIKNYMGYRNLPQSMIKKDTCSTYPNVNNNGKFYCGTLDQYQELNPNETRSIEESNLKHYVETIFGQNSYQSADFFYAGVNNYALDQASKHYVYRTVSGGGVTLQLHSKLVGATKSPDEITITENISCTSADRLCPSEQFSQNITHTFVKESDNNYYYHSTKKS